MDAKAPAVYILASKWRGTLYIGVTSDLVKRIWEHKQGLAEGFTKQREKQIKKWNRAWKVELIEQQNPDWRDLWPEIVG